ncbi:MAG: hypothetical protein JW875_09480 [Spirochaetales bacterium]|nr:hypothetical protein [Spirochaetales bacterium]
MKKSCVLLVIGILVCAFAHSAGKGFITLAGSEAKTERILIASAGSAFKDELVQGLVNSLDNGNRLVLGSDLKALRSVEPSDYRAIIILGSIKAGKADGKIRNFAQKHPGSSNVVVVNTWGGEPKAISLELDAISSASIKEKAPGIERIILERLHLSE